MPNWTPAEDQALIRAWIRGLSASHIARDLGRTRNAVLGRAQRLVQRGLIQPRQSPLKTKENKAMPRRRIKNEEHHRAALPVPPSTRTQAYPPARTCQWPSGDGPFTFDCKSPPASPHPYCIKHLKRAYARLPENFAPGSDLKPQTKA